MELIDGARLLHAQDPAAKELAEAFGLPTEGLVGFTLRISAGTFAELSATFRVTMDEAKTVQHIARNYSLIEIPEPVDV